MFYSIFIYLLFLRKAISDTPANCTYEDARGRWEFHIYPYSLNCYHKFGPNQTNVVELLYPNVAIDQYGNGGYWTLIYNQGFEVTINYRKWLVMFAYNKDGEYYCNKGLPFWTHDTLIRQWKCFVANKLQKIESNLCKVSCFLSPVLKLSTIPTLPNNVYYRINHEFVNSINLVQKSWEATVYPEFETFTMAQLRRLAGGSKSMFPKLTRKYGLTSSKEVLSMVSELPVEFDWRTPPGGLKSPVTPIRNQNKCGSCYAFASTAAFESRIRLISNFTQNPILSPQDIVDCSAYSQGCDGGFPYLIAGKYAEDFGMVEESCNPYTGNDTKVCKSYKLCKRYYASNYKYIGGYYGASNEHLMQLELVHNGPFPIGFEVYQDFMHYKSGVYQHTGLGDAHSPFNPFELTNHAVVVVGYGMDKATKLPYWAVKNSWGSNWGENGFFRILRGSDECSVESLGISFDPVI